MFDAVLGARTLACALALMLAACGGDGDGREQATLGRKVASGDAALAGIVVFVGLAAPRRAPNVGQPLPP